MAVWVAHRPHGPRANRYFLSGAGSTVVADALARIEAPTVRRGDLPVAAEALHRTAADSLSFIEVLAATVRASRLGTEAAETAFVSLRSPIEATGTVAALLVDQWATIEWSAVLRQEEFPVIEVLHMVPADDQAGAEWLSSWNVIVADSDLQIEGVGAASTTLISIEADPNRLRVLATPGRVRLLWRN